jgi:hypothetical protein
MANSDTSKLLRLSTIVAAVSTVFTADDAIGLSNNLPPARKIGLGRRSLTGFLTSAQKVEGNGAFESALERDYFTLLEFDRRVLAWHPQPVKIKVPGRANRYTPDVAVEYTDTDDSSNLERVELCEIKYRDEIKRNWTDLKPALMAGRRYARSQGWRFEIYSEVEIRTPRLQNAKFFLGYVERGTDEEDIYRVARALENLGPTTPTKLLDRFDLGDRGRLMGVLWHMVAKNHVLADFDREVVHMNSRISLNEPAIV